jgi:hypothetical protein
LTIDIILEINPKIGIIVELRMSIKDVIILVSKQFILKKIKFKQEKKYGNTKY